MGQADPVQHSKLYYHVHSIKVTIAAFLLLFCSQIEATDPANKCLDNQFTVVHANGNTSCEDCGKCPKGQGLSHACGGQVDPNAMVTCVLCRGNTFSSRDDSSNCAPCSSCAEDQVVLQKCTSTQDVVCDNKCYGLDRYFDEHGFCLTCSKCCGDGGDKVKDECKSKLGAASENVCAFNHSGNHCDKSTTPGTVATTNSTEMTRNATSIPNVTAAPTQTSATGGSFASTSVSGRSTSGHTKKIIIISIVVLSIALVPFCVMKIVTALRRKCNQSHGGNRDEGTGPSEAGENSCLVQMSNTVSKPLKDLVNDPSDYLSEICKRLDTPLPGVGNYEEAAKYYNFDVYTIRVFKESQGGPSKALISAIMARYPKVTVEMFATVVAKQANRGDVADWLRAFDCK